MAELFFTEQLNNPLGIGKGSPTPAAQKFGENDVGTMEGMLSAGRSRLANLQIQEAGLSTRQANLTTDLANLTSQKLAYDRQKEEFGAKQRQDEAKLNYDNIKRMFDDEINSPQYEEKKRLSKQIAEYSVFEPTQVTAPMLGVLFSAIGATGMLLGGNSKNHAKAALSAMNGMTEGFAKGREQYDKERKAAFDTNVKLLQTKLSAIKDGLEDARREAVLNKQAADQKVRETLAANEAQFLKTNYDNRGLESTIALVNGQLQNINQATNLLSSKISQLTGQLDSKETQILMRKIEAASRESEKRIAAEQRQRELEQRQKKLTPVGMQGDNIVMSDELGNITLVPTGEGFVPKAGIQPRPEPRTPAPRTGKGGGTGGDKFGFGDIIATNLNEAVGTISNIVNLPHDVTGGIFQGRNTSGLLMAPLGVLAQELTDEDVQRYNKEIKNFGKFASRVVSGGRVVPASVQKDFEDQFVINKGDSPLSVLTSLAQMRQTLERAIEVKLKSSSTDPGLKTLYQDGLDVIRNSIPFTVNDVNTFANQRDKKKTFSQMFGEYGFRSPSATTGAGPVTPSTPAPAQPKTPAIPPGVPSTAQYSPSQNSWWWQENNQWKSKKVD